jgi:hypothetical protein
MAGGPRGLVTSAVSDTEVTLGIERVGTPVLKRLRVLLSSFLSRVILTVHCLVLRPYPSFKLRDKMKTTYAFQSQSFPLFHIPLFLCFSSHVSRSRTTSNGHKPLPCGNPTLSLTLLNPSFIRLHLLYSITITGTPRSPLLYKT